MVYLERVTGGGGQAILAAFLPINFKVRGMIFGPGWVTLICIRDEDDKGRDKGLSTPLLLAVGVSKANSNEAFFVIQRYSLRCQCLSDARMSAI